MKRAVAIAMALGAIYLVGYAALRTANAETWERDGQSTVIFPEGSLVLYYLYRPLSYADQALTGTRAHIGPHGEGAA